MFLLLVSPLLIISNLIFNNEYNTWLWIYNTHYTEREMMKVKDKGNRVVKRLRGKGG